MATNLHDLDLHDPAVRRHFHIQMALKRVRPGSGPETLWARTWRRPVFDLRTITTVPFVVVGGVATRLYSPERATGNLDILVEGRHAERLFQDLAAQGISERTPDGIPLKIWTEDAAWAAEAIRNPAFVPNGLPVIALPYLTLMKMKAGWAIDIGDLSRVLGAADEASLAQTREVMVENYPEGIEDLEGLIVLGQLEYGVRK